MHDRDDREYHIISIINLQDDRVGSHHASELWEADHTVSVPVHHVHHLLRLLHAADLTQHELHLVPGDAAGLVLAEHSERLLVVDLLVLVRLEFLRQSRGKLRPLNLSTPVHVQLIDHVLNFLLIRIDSAAIGQSLNKEMMLCNLRSSECKHEFLGGNMTVIVVVEIIEGSFVLVYILGLKRQLWFLLFFSEGATQYTGRAA